MNPRQSRLGVPSVTPFMTVTKPYFLRLLHDGGRVGTTSRLAVQRILRDDRVEPSSPAGALLRTTIIFPSLALFLIREKLHAQDKAFRLKYKQVG